MSASHVVEELQRGASDLRGFSVAPFELRLVIVFENLNVFDQPGIHMGC
jgi:hypothetical protein